MGIDQEEAARILHHHFAWVKTMRPQWQEIRAAYEDDFYREHGSGGRRQVHTVIPTSITWQGAPLDTASVASGDVARTQVNIVKGFVGKFEAGMVFRGDQIEAHPDQRISIDEAADHGKLSRAIGENATRFLEAVESVDTDDQSLKRQSLQQALLYTGGGAFVLNLDEPDPRIPGQGPDDLVWMEYLSPWEAVWDRRAKGRHRYMGRLRSVSVEELERLMSLDGDRGWKRVDIEEEMRIALPDVVSGEERASDPRADKSYVQVFELMDFQCSITMDAILGEVSDAPGEYPATDDDTEETGAVETVGVLTVYLVRGPSTLEGSVGDLVELFRGPMPYSETNGRPLCNIIPVILDPHPDFPSMNLAAAKRVFDLVKELNLAMSGLATAFRRDLNRVVLYLKGKGLGEDQIASIMTCPDMTFIGLDSETLVGLFEVLDMPPLSPTLLHYISFLRESLTDTQVLADQMGGKAAKYQTATQTATLVDYSESTLGLLRAKADRVTARVAAVYQAVFRVACGRMGWDSFLVRVDDDVVVVPVEALERRWRYTVVDAATTPAQRTASLDRFIQAEAPMMMQAAEILEPTAPGAMAELARLILQHIVKLGGLPAAMARIGGSAPPAAAMAPPPGMPPEGESATVAPSEPPIVE